MLALKSLTGQLCVSCGAAGNVMCAVVLASGILAGSNRHVVTRQYRLAIRGTVRGTIWYDLRAEQSHARSMLS